MAIIKFLKDLISKDQTLLSNILVIVGLISAFYGFLLFVCKVVKVILKLFKSERLYRHLKPYFTKNDIRLALENYIPTQCQNIDPAKDFEPARSHAYSVRQKLIPFFIKTVFREKKDEKYYLVLADSGMGKTTFMINLFLKYMKKWFKEYHMVLVPLGHPKADDKINAVTDKTGTILLLDAFDEDARAAKNYKERMNRWRSHKFSRFCSFKMSHLFT